MLQLILPAFPIISINWERNISTYKLISIQPTNGMLQLILPAFPITSITLKGTSAFTNQINFNSTNTIRMLQLILPAFPITFITEKGIPTPFHRTYKLISIQPTRGMLPLISATFPEYHDWCQPFEILKMYFYSFHYPIEYSLIVSTSFYQYMSNEQSWEF